jgi:hypothetical protein
MSLIFILGAPTAAQRRSKVISATMPPSPLLLRRMTSTT